MDKKIIDRNYLRYIPKIEICSKCGCAAREIEVAAWVRCELNEDGTIGKVLFASKPYGVPTFVCGGGHKWKL